MTIDELKEYYGNGNQFELRTGISHVNFLNWCKWGYIPIKSQMRIETATNGELKANIHHIPWQEDL